MSTMPRGRKVWAGIILVALVYETVGILTPGDEDTLSEFLRWLFHTDTTAGKVTFGVGWVAFAAWMLPHILNRPKRVDAAKRLKGHVPD